MVFAVLLIFIAAVNAAHNILNFGAIPFKTDVATENGNAAAFYKAVMFAYNHGFDKQVLIPANYTFSMINVQTFKNISQVTIPVNGTVLLSKH